MFYSVPDEFIERTPGSGSSGVSIFDTLSEWLPGNHTVWFNYHQ